LIIIRSRTLTTLDRRYYAWNGLARFKNISYTTKQIIALHGLPEKHRRNAIKQAEQIRYCIVQAEEYFTAARTVSAATKPLLLYYGVMSLALAELLLKQSGDSSLDRARGQHAHHGLTLSIVGNPSANDDLVSAASSIRALPLVRANGSRFGTFELWHRSSRETPFSGTHSVVHPNGISTRGLSVVATPDDLRPHLLPESGFSLQDCFDSLPTMMDTLSFHGRLSALVRAKMSSGYNAATKYSTHTTVIHPYASQVLAKVYSKFRYPPGMVDSVQVAESGSGGCVIRTNAPPEGSNYESEAPFGFQVSSDEVLFSSENQSLNEFGLFYAATYILGNYARYYPDFWMRDVEAASPLALSSVEFLMQCEERVPLLALSEMSRIYHLTT
jgi:hypothetical protein